MLKFWVDTKTNLSLIEAICKYKTNTSVKKRKLFGANSRLLKFFQIDDSLRAVYQVIQVNYH